MDIGKILRHPATVPAAIGLVSFGGGLAVGLFLGNRAAWKKAIPMLQDQVDTEITEIKERHTGRVVIPEDHPAFAEQPQPRHEVTVEEHIRRKLESVQEIADDEEPAVVAHNVFAQDDIDWNYEEEKKNRSSDAPYILHRDEFFAKEMPGFAQKTLTYWDGDDTLAFDGTPPVVIYNRDQVVGNDNLKFGHGSGEEHVVYIRNESRMEEYEVIREEGMFSIEKMGFEFDPDDIKHSSDRRFREQE